MSATRRSSVRLPIGTILFALGAATGPQVLLTLFTSLFARTPSGGYGAPVPVGESHVSIFFGGPQTFMLPLFVLNVAITAVPFFLFVRWSGFLGATLATVGAVGSLVLTVYMGLSRAPVFPFAGLPIPLNPDLPNPLVLWVDMLLWAAAAAFVGRWIGRRWGQAIEDWIMRIPGD